MNDTPSEIEAIAFAKKMRQREASRKHNAKRKRDPAYMERQRQHHRKRQADPEYAERARQRMREWLAKPENAARIVTKRAIASSPERRAVARSKAADPAKREQNKARMAAWRAKEGIKEAERDYNRSPETRSRQREWQAARIKVDPQFRIARTLRARLQGVMNGTATASGVRDLGCSVADLIAYLEAQFEPWMSWTNYGNKAGDWWSVDHIRPLASFDLTDPEQQRTAVHFTNLQPMRHTDNMRKGKAWTP